MRSYSIRLPKPKKEYVDVFVVCCLHIGHRNYNESKALNYRDYILKTPDTYVVDLGDDIENALPGDEKHNAMMWDQVLGPDMQLVKAKEFWLPVAEAGKLLLTHRSNHWDRAYKKTGIDYAAEMNSWLKANSRKKGLPVYGNWQALGGISVGKQHYVLHSWHGAGGGSTPEGALKKCRAKAWEHHADIYTMGHFHKRLNYVDEYFSFDREHECHVKRQRTYISTGSFLEWEEGYGEMMGLPPVQTGAQKFSLSSKRHDVRI